MSPRLPERRLRQLARASWWFCAAALLSRAAVAVVDPGAVSLGSVLEDGGLLVLMVAFPLAGRLVLGRQPRTRIGWLLAGTGVVWSVGGLALSYAHLGRVTDPGSLPGVEVAALVAQEIWAPALGVTWTFTFLLFPDGHLPSPRWRPIAWVSGAALVSLTVCLALSPGALGMGPGAGWDNPWGIDRLGPFLAAAQDVLIALLALCVLACAGAVVSRFHDARGVERQQLTWLAAAAVVVGASIPLGKVAEWWLAGHATPGWQEALDETSFVIIALIPLAITVAVLRYRLYDIDVVINRALVYGSLTAALVATYLGSVLLLQLVLRPLTERSDLAVAASTLAVAALFGPARRRIQDAVDRRFYRHRYDAARTVTDFSARLRQQIDLDTVADDLLAAVHETVQPTAATVWLPGTRRTP